MRSVSRPSSMLAGGGVLRHIVGVLVLIVLLILLCGARDAVNFGW